MSVPAAIRNMALAVALVAGLGGVARAQAGACRASAQLGLSSAIPRLFSVSVAGRLAPGDVVVVTGRAGSAACGTAVGPPPGLRETSRWLPVAALSPVTAGAIGPRAWAGVWRTGFDQNIVIGLGGGRLSIKGDAAWGGQDPARLAAGTVNTGELDARAAPRAGWLAFPARAAAGGPGAPARFARRTAGGCAAEMWRMGPYLVVVDNDRCGGANVSFTGVYRRVAG